MIYWHYDDTYGKLLGGPQAAILFHDCAPLDEPVKHPGAGIVAAVQPQHADKAKDLVRMANCHPKLLEACKDALAWQIQRFPMPLELEQQIRAAIAKAEGTE